MKIIGLVILFLSAFVSSAFAQVELNPRFDEQSNAAIGEANSSRNVVSEPFFKFICSFRDDEDFRNERIKINVEYEVEDYETMGADDVPEENSFEFEIEDVFSITGRGTVVTGKVIKGTVMNGDTVSINGILDTRILGIESFRSTKEQATEGEQVGLLLEGIERYQVVPGEKIYK